MNTSASALFSAIRDNKLMEAKALIEANQDLLKARDERGTSPLILASYSGLLPMTKLLVEAGADINASGTTGTALMGVCFKGHADIARYLINAGADLEASLPNGSTALHFAAMFNQAEIVELLVAAGADAGAKDVDGLTAADHATKRGFTALAERLG
ncbi:ankyrin repeat domain-containing protein [Neolewinella agarilytica]|uniref:ankyrin repeat domain-containing protein n=1 Tax=Neolewinella agarilytica TaxID=478744 RepID=UPI002354241B|nr:ankyrin repeat domain-containing protein [Neolewinella agarilytica]